MSLGQAFQGASSPAALPYSRDLSHDPSPPDCPGEAVLVRCDLPVSPPRAPQVFLVPLAPPDCL